MPETAENLDTPSPTPPGRGRPTVMQVVPELVTGGVERGTVDVAKALVEAGFRAIVVSNGGPMQRELDRAGAEHITLNTKTKNLFRMRKNAERLAEIIAAEGVDIIHARSRAPAWSAYWASKRANIPFVTTFHATYNITGPLKRFYNSVMTRGDRVIAISHAIKTHMLKEYSIEEERIRVIHRGTDLDLYNPENVSPERVVSLSEKWRLPDGVPVVMLPGRLARWKGQLLLLEALAQLKDRKMRCLLVGSAQGRNAYVREIEDTAKRLGIADRVHVVGDCKDVPAALKLADVVISASTDPEGFGRVAVEGQAMGRPVVAPNHGAAPEQIVPGETGWLFTPGDPTDLARCIEEALSLTESQRERLYYACIANARMHFGKQQMTDRILDVYREVLNPATQLEKSA